ncbi:hypothetical protein [Serinicoccus sp. LYQ131]|uniref:hypothetical protein n=1 Tax=Serinicoccus sp. LYQ131 TaxID=3378797 RepID=UPI003852F202
MTSRPVLRCAVVGPHGWLGLSEALADSVATVVDLALSSDPVATIRRSTFVIAFLDGGTSSTLVDVGVALALKKPLLLVAEASSDIPDRLLGYPWLLTEGLAYEDLVLQIKGFASAFLPKPTTARDRAVKVLRTGPHHFLRETPPGRSESTSKPISRQPSREQFHSDTEFRVAQILSRAGATVVAQMREPSALSIPDLAASFPGLGPSFSTVLIEIAARQARLASKKSALRSAMEERGLQLGVLVTLEEPEDAEPEFGILTISLQQLEDLVETNKLLPTLRILRNRVVHRIS